MLICGRDSLRLFFYKSFTPDAPARVEIISLSEIRSHILTGFLLGSLLIHIKNQLRQFSSSFQIQARATTLLISKLKKGLQTAGFEYSHVFIGATERLKLAF